MKPKRIILVGPGGSGKDFLSDLLVAEGYRKAVSCTTRPMRVNERDGVHYHFISTADFKRRIKRDKFREWNQFGEDKWYYGTLLSSFQKATLFIMNPRGLSRLTADERKEFTVIYLDIPERVRKERLTERADADSVSRRLYTDAMDFHGFSDCDVVIDDPAFTIETVLAACG